MNFPNDHPQLLGTDMLPETSRYPLRMQDCWPAYSSEENCQSLVLPGAVLLTALPLAKQLQVNTERFVQHDLPRSDVETDDVQPLELVQDWLRGGGSDTDMVKLRFALEAARETKKALPEDSPHRMAADSLSKKIRNDLRERVEEKLEDVHWVMARSPRQLWVSICRMGKPLPEAAAKLSHFVVFEGDVPPPTLRAVLKDMHGQEGFCPPNSYITGLLVGEPNELHSLHPGDIQSELENM